jgi:hypothetical protein
VIENIMPWASSDIDSMLWRLMVEVESMDIPACDVI